LTNDPDRRRIESYLAGEAATAHEVDGWIRREIEICYPALWREADDIRQAVHGKLLENLRAARFQFRSTLKTYVGRITHHTAIDRIRKNHRERSVPADWRIESASTGENPYRSLAALEEQDLMDQVLLRSPAPCRELWRLVFLEQLSYAEIGRRLSIPPGTVKSRMWHCRRKALALLEQLQRNARKKQRGGAGG
jgi:RNA polymerase sigma-70 factor (ECF subfamily)